MRSVLGQVAALLPALTVRPLDDGRPVGRLLARSATADVVDAHLVLCAVRTGHDILTGDPGDLVPLAGLFGPTAQTVHPWPCSPGAGHASISRPCRARCSAARSSAFQRRDRSERDTELFDPWNAPG